MSDKKLLELAAKAVGIKITWCDGLPRNTTGFHPSKNIYAASFWNPLEDDGDALRMAIKLGLTLHVFHSGPIFVGQSITPFTELEIEESAGKDPYAATRRAIVRAAAEIGKEMK